MLLRMIMHPISIFGQLWKKNLNSGKNGFCPLEILIPVRLCLTPWASGPLQWFSGPHCKVCTWLQFSHLRTPDPGPRGVTMGIGARGRGASENSVKIRQFCCKIGNLGKKSENSELGAKDEIARITTKLTFNWRYLTKIPRISHVNHK